MALDRPTRSQQKGAVAESGLNIRAFQKSM